MTRSLLNPKITLKMSATLQNTLDDDSVTGVAQPSLNYTKTLTDGIGADQANRAWQSSSRIIASGAQETIDLYDMGGLDVGAGAGNDGVGQACDFEEIVAVVVVNDNAVGAVGQLEVLPASSNGWSPIGTYTVATGGALRGQGVLVMLQPAEQGFDVTDLSSHRVTFRAVGGDVSYSVYLLARHEDDVSSSSSSSSSSPSSSSQSISSSSSSSLSASSSSLSASSSSQSTSSGSSSSSSSLSTSSSSASSSSSESSSSLSSRSSSSSLSSSSSPSSSSPSSSQSASSSSSQSSSSSSESSSSQSTSSSSSSASSMSSSSWSSQSSVSSSTSSSSP